MPAPIVVPLRSARVVRNLALGSALCLVLGLAGVLGSILGSGPAGTRVAGVVVGLAFLVLGLVIGAGLPSANRTQSLVLDEHGIRWEVARRGWSVPWTELTSASVHVGNRTGHGLRKLPRVRLELVPAVPSGFDRRHPQLAHLHSPYFGGSEHAVSIPFADRPDLVEPIARGLAAFGGGRDGGVVDDGNLRGPGYSPR